MHILFEKELLAHFQMADAIDAVEKFFVSAAKEQVVTPARHSVMAGNGGLTFTIGAELEETQTIGFRVYGTFPNLGGTDKDQIVAVFSAENGRLKGIVIGPALGAIRTAAIGGVAMKYMAAETVETAALIGTGYQAGFQLQALLAVRQPRQVLICNRTASHADPLVQLCREKYGTAARYERDVETAVRQADILICATSAKTAVFKSDWLKPNAYVATIGPKSAQGHELPIEAAKGAKLLVTDAKAQLPNYKGGYFLDDLTAIESLEAIVAREIKPPHLGQQIFLSSGRSGTEVVVADRALQLLGG